MKMSAGQELLGPESAREYVSREGRNISLLVGQNLGYLSATHRRDWRIRDTDGSFTLSRDLRLVTLEFGIIEQPSIARYSIWCLSVGSRFWAW